MILEGRQRFAAEYAVGGPINPRTGSPFGSNTKAFREWSDAQGKPVLTDDQNYLIEQMAQKTVIQVRTGLSAFVHHDTGLAEQVIASDDGIDRMNSEVIQVLTDQMLEDPHWIPPAIECFSAARGLEQIADHAVNVAEDVIYMVEGVIVRHRFGTAGPAGPRNSPPSGD